VKLGPSRIVAHHSPVRARNRPVRRVFHRAPPAPMHHHGSAPLPSVVTYAARPVPPPIMTTAQPVQADRNPPPTRPSASQSSASAAQVSPTGQSGALGPIHSPNG
jgi:hypothetical protein